MVSAKALWHVEKAHFAVKKFLACPLVCSSASVSHIPSTVVHLGKHGKDAHRKNS